MNRQSIPNAGTVILTLAIGVALILVLGCGSESPQTTREPDLPSRQKLADQQKRSLEERLLVDPGDARALEELGDVAARRGDSIKAIEFYRAAWETIGKPTPTFLSKLARQTMIAGQPFEVVAIQSQLIDLDPNSMEARTMLVGLATMLGLEQIAKDQLRWLVLHNHCDFEGLVVLSHPEFVQPDVELCQEMLRRSPDDQRAQYGLAKSDAMKWRWNEVVQRLTPVMKLHPGFVQGHALLGRALVELNDVDRIAQWSSDPPKEIEDSSTYWVAAGLWSERQHREDIASEALAQAAKLEDWNNAETLAHLARVLNLKGQSNAGKQITDRIRQLTRLHDATKTFFERDGQSSAAAMEVALTLVDLGRLWEAEGWGNRAVELVQDRPANVEQQYLQIRSKLTPTTPLQLELGWEHSFNQSSYPPEIVWNDAPMTMRTPSERNSSVIVRLVNEANQRGLVHQMSMASISEPGQWIYQSYGGGAASVDFDNDGWPDVALAVLDGLPLQENSQTDRFYRNVAGQFEDVTSFAGLKNHGFTQGISAGDYNSDGFTDLYVCAIGTNRLFQNNGDGTWQDVTENVGLSNESWTCSSALADINGDSIVDIFEVNYCSGTKPFEQPCRNRTTGELSNCTPLDFDAQFDRVWMGTPSGRFQDVTSIWMNQEIPGRGLGLVVGMLDEVPGLDVYVANDMTANHFWSGSRSNDAFELNEQGVYRGVAVSGQSLSQASMGIAAGDADRDGDLDLFLTHFTDEHNTFYEQVGPGLWTDRSHAVGLAEPSMELLGFGTQFVDFDNNSELELIIANGHISDLKRKDVMHEMPAQLFYRTDQDRWQEIARDQLGDYFSADHLGRALITLDADRNGFTDVLITDLVEPVALLINHTGEQEKSLHQSISIRLQGTKSERDAIGASVTGVVGNRELYGQLTAGDGYMGSNQRVITFGLGQQNALHDVTIRWPSGKLERIGTLQSGQEYLVVEGQNEAYHYSGAK